MKIALISDAWAPQINGVVRTLVTTVARVRALGHVVETVTPDQFATLPCPSYPEIRLALGAGARVARRLSLFEPDAVHIATEGPLGWAARRWCLTRDMPFTTSFHTRFPDYLAMRMRLPVDLFWPLVRRFHAPAAAVFAATATLQTELATRGLPHTHRWSRGVDMALFTPDGPALATIADLPRPILLNVGRVAVEKNIDAFLGLDVPGTKVVVGDGPALAALQARHPDVRFLGALHGQALASAYRTADVLVFSSRSDTFGLVMVEAMACGVPVAAYPVQGPLDVIGDTPAGVLDADLARAVDHARRIDPLDCVRESRRYDWDASAAQFFSGLHPCPRRRLVA